MDDAKHKNQKKISRKKKVVKKKTAKKVANKSPNEDEKKGKGRPTKYDPKFCSEMLSFFDRAITKKVVMKKSYHGAVFDMPVDVPCEFPTFEKFATSIGVHRDTLHEWKKYDEFSDTYKKCQNFQKNILIQNGLMGRYEGGFAKFVAINCTDMTDKQQLEHTGKDGAPIQTEIDYSKLSTEELKELKELAKKAQGC